MKPYDNQAGKKEQVRTMFDAIARRYDLLNHLLSLGIDRGWRRKLVRGVRRSGALRILDVATGTGDLAILTAKAIPDARITGIDLSEQMLAIGSEKIFRARLDARIALETGDAEALRFDTGEFDAVTVAFGVRNFENLRQGVGELFRVLRPGGTLWVLEFGMPRLKLFGSVYRLYFHRVLPFLGGIISRDRKAYSYLPRSVEGFPYGQGFAGMLKDAGFVSVGIENLFGGVAQLYRAEKDL